MWKTVARRLLKKEFPNVRHYLGNIDGLGEHCKLAVTTELVDDVTQEQPQFPERGFLALADSSALRVRQPPRLRLLSFHENFLRLCFNISKYINYSSWRQTIDKVGQLLRRGLVSDMPTFENQKEESLTTEARRPTIEARRAAKLKSSKGCGGAL